MLKLVIISVLALTGQDGPKPDGRMDTDRPRQHGVYRQLFAVPPIVVPGLPVTQKADEPTPRGRHIEVIPPKQFTMTTGPCNMPVMVGDASVDPGILIPSPHSAAGKHKIRVVAPNACGEKVP